MIESMMKNVAVRLITELYPHLQLPSVMAAEIKSVSDCGTYHEYSLKILDASGAPDERCPEIPNIRSRDKYERGTRVAVGLLNGTLDPYILGEVL